jgi:peptidoglycan/LPS O-acetylase OafA/YrhL
MKEIKALTALRGLFAFWVLGYHLNVLSPGPINDPIGFLSRGYLGVDFFFLLSGFVLADAYGKIFVNRYDQNAYWRFIAKRAGRMMPLNWVVTLICVGVAWWFGSPYSPIQVTEEMALIHRWPFVPALFNAINGPAWSISSEMLVNLAFPLVVALTLAPSRILLPLATLAAAAFGLIAIAARHHWSLDITLANTLSPTVRCFAEFSTGMLIYRWRAVRLGRHAPAVIAALAVMALIADVGDLTLVGLMPFAIMALASSEGLAARILASGPLYRLGQWSFSIYLVHLPIMRAVQFVVRRLAIGTVWQAITFAAASIVLAIGISAITYRLIECPARDASKRWADQLFRKPAVVA